MITSSDVLPFTVHGEATEWRGVVDHGAESPDDFREPSRTMAPGSLRYTIGPHSVLLRLRPRRASA
jgi:hypothetical protein